MKAFLVAAFAAIILAYGASIVLDRTWQTTSATAYTTPSVRLADPGNNLVGADWPSTAATAGES